MAPPRPFKLFISYSHRNESCKDRLKINLAPLVRTGWAELWDDREIPAGADWREAIETAMAEADAVVFLVDDDFLASDFCMDVEVGGFLAQHRDEGTLIIFVVTDYCGWSSFDYIAKFQVIPQDGRPITSYRPQSRAYTQVQEKIKQALAGHQPKVVAKARFSDTTFFQAAIPPPVPTGLGLSALLDKLPGQTPHLFGRENELAMLDAWHDRKGVFLWVADGGFGKSTLVRSWLQNQNWPPETRFLGHSFYRHGRREDSAGARGFLIEALKQLNIHHDDNAPDEQLGRLLAEAAAQEPTVLVLDGIEPLQAHDGAEKTGRLRDAGLATLLEELARHPGQAQCLASSRRGIADAGIREADAFHEQPLDVLSPPDALALLRYRGLIGTDAELASVAERCGHQPLALVLAAEFGHGFLDGKAEALLARDWTPPAPDRHAATVMAWLDCALAEENQALDRELMHILGLFERPAPWGALLALQAAEPPIPELTEQLHDADETALAESLARLVQWGLLQTDLTATAPELDCHPLVREFFAHELAVTAPESWRRAHGVLFEWFRQLPEKERPDTLKELKPLYRAVRHGCLASRYQEALDEVYRDRILRGMGPDRFYSAKKLGAFGADLGAAACFFAEPWRRLVPDLAEGDQAWLLNEAATRLRALGRQEEALEPMAAGAEMAVTQEDWESAAIRYSNLSELQLSLGRIGSAVEDAERAVVYADRSGDAFQRMSKRTTLANARHQQGEWEAARDGFAEAEAMQREHQPQYPLLYSVQGFQYCELLLAEAERKAWGRRDGGAAADGEDCAQVAARAQKMFEWRVPSDPLLDIALDHLTLARCALYTDLLLGSIPGDEAQRRTEAAVTGLRKAGQQDELPHGLLTRTWLRHCQGDVEGAQADLNEAQRIAERGGMKLHLADIALTRGRLFKDNAELAKARTLIKECGYGRRLPELEDAEKRLAEIH